MITGKNDVRNVEKKSTIIAMTTLQMLTTLRYVTFFMMKDLPLLIFMVRSHAITSVMKVGTPMEYSMEIITLCELGEISTVEFSMYKSISHGSAT